MDFTKYPLLKTIDSPADLKKLSYEEIDRLCAEIRELLIENVDLSGGHLASNLGVVELTIALHRTLNMPSDKIVFDVGHQCYTHKLLTGRREFFDTLRSPGGLSGFTKRGESPYDAFGAGHSSTSVSAALGLAIADKFQGLDNVTVALLGDGAFTGGIVHEALNNIPADLPFIIVLNENEMSIAKNTGAFASHIAKIRNSGSYYKAKKHTRNIISGIPLIGKPIIRAMIRSKQFIKNAIYSSNYFEDMGLFYIGPVDGHDVQRLEGALKDAISRKTGVIIHVKTTKGKGMVAAEEAPALYHSVTPKAKRTDSATFSSTFGELMCEYAQKDDKICAITAAMADGCGLSGFEAAFPNRLFDVGIAEEHAAIFAAGLAAGGMKPVFAVYSTFLQRAYDCVIHDVALQNLPVIFAIDRAGLAAADGPTHHGIYDVAFLSTVPNVEIWSPYDYASLKTAFESAMKAENPVCIRYPSGVENSEIARQVPIQKGHLRLSFEGECDGYIITYGRITAEAIRACARLKELGKNVKIILLNRLRPYGLIASEILEQIGGDNAPVVFLEEGVRAAGASENLCRHLLQREGLGARGVKILAIHGDFGFSKKGESLYKTLGICADNVVDAFCNM